MVDKQPLFSQLPAAQQELALQRFQIIQPFLEGRVLLTYIVRTHRLALRTARRWVQRYRADGLAGLVRSIRADRGTRRGMSLEMQQFIQELVQREGEASVASLHRRVLHAATERGWPAPSYSRVYAIVRSLKALPRAEQADLLPRRRGGRVAWRYEGMPRLFPMVGSPLGTLSPT